MTTDISDKPILIWMDHQITVNMWGEFITVIDGEAFESTTLKEVKTHINNFLKLEAIREWAFRMGCMYEDCTYLSHEAFNKDAQIHLTKLVELVGVWIPPEIRDSSQAELKEGDRMTMDHLAKSEKRATRYENFIKIIHFLLSAFTTIFCTYFIVYYDPPFTPSNTIPLFLMYLFGFMNLIVSSTELTLGWNK